MTEKEALITPALYTMQNITVTAAAGVVTPDLAMSVTALGKAIEALAIGVQEAAKALQVRGGKVGTGVHMDCGKQ